MGGCHLPDLPDPSKPDDLASIECFRSEYSDIVQIDGNISLNTSISSDLYSSCELLFGKNISSSSSSYTNTCLDTSLCSSISFSSNSECSNANISAENSWFSQISDCDSAQPQLVSSNPIPVVIGYCPPKVTINNRQTVRQVIRRETNAFKRSVYQLFCPTI